MKNSILMDVVLPSLLGLMIFGGLTWVANTYIFQPGFPTVPGSVVFGAQTATVSATVQVQSLSVTVSDGSISYGVLQTSASGNTVGGDTQTGTNAGNVAEDVNIQGWNTANWTLEPSAGAEQYFHKFTTNSAAAGAGWTDVGDGAYTLMEDALAVSATATFDMKLGVPSSTSSAGVTQDASITLQATAN